MEYIIFLDVDGVLNQLQPWYIDNTCIKNLGQLCRKLHTTKIVLTSSWRKGWNRDITKCTPQIMTLTKYLNAEGLSIIGRTRDLGDRLVEVLDYCESHNIKRYLILDDDRTEFSRNAKNLYITNSETGLTIMDIKNIKRLCK